MICMTTQCYDVPSSRIRNWYVGIILVELDGIWNFHWNMERVIFFRRVILKRVSQVSGSRNIRERIDSHPNLWNKVA